jgi:integrase
VVFMPGAAIVGARSSRNDRFIEPGAMVSTNLPSHESMMVGEPYSLQVLSRGWRKAAKRAGVREIKLHAARHTCATLMHLSGVPTVVIAAWIGHSDPTLTMRLYAQSQADALAAAGDSLAAVVSPPCHYRLD